MWWGKFIKRLSLLFFLTLMAVSGHADSWLGIQGLVFRPDVMTTSGTQGFNRFDGAGVELGWICHKRFDVGLAVHGAYADPFGVLVMPSGNTVHKMVLLVTVLYRTAYRFRAPYMPNLGVGFGEVTAFTHYEYSGEASHLNHTAAYDRFIWVPMVGYDFRRSRRFGLKLEGQYQPRDVVYIKGFTLLGEAYLAW